MFVKKVSDDIPHGSFASYLDKEPKDVKSIDDQQDEQEEEEDDDLDLIKEEHYAEPEFKGDFEVKVEAEEDQDSDFELPRCTSSRPVKKAKKDRTMYPCDTCDYVADRPFYLKKHKASQHGQTGLACPKCNFTTDDSKSLSKHVQRVHGERKIYACNMCEYKTAHQRSMKLHKEAKKTYL